MFSTINEDNIVNILYGVNHNIYKPKNLNNNRSSLRLRWNYYMTIGINHGSITTIHNLTNSQTLLIFLIMTLVMLSAINDNTYALFKLFH